MNDIEERIRAAVQAYRANENVSVRKVGGATPIGRSVEEGARSRSRRRSRLAIVLTVAVLLIGTGAAVAGVVLYTGETPPPLQNAIDDIFRGGACVTGADATQEINDALTTLRYSDWTIESRPGATADHCVVAGFVSSTRQIVLLPVSGPTLSAALQSLNTALLGACFGKEEATALVTSVLSAVGETDFTVSTDGPLAFPLGQGDAVRSHVASGCFVYSATGWDAEGRQVVYIIGPAG